jgi:hypothetical protein
VPLERRQITELAAERHDLGGFVPVRPMQTAIPGRLDLDAYVGEGGRNG